MKLKIAISLVLGTVVSGLALYFALRNVPFGDLKAYLATINYVWILPSVGLVLLAFGLRVYRWQLILQARHQVDFWTALHPLMIGFAINSILPGRVGEIARPVILNQKKGIAFSAGLATVATERALDAFTLIMLFALVLLKVQPDPNLTIRFGDLELTQRVLESIAAGMVKLCAVLFLGIIFVSIDRTRRLLYAVIDRIPALLRFAGAKMEAFTVKICDIMKKILDNFADGFALIKQPKMLILSLGTSIIIWLLTGLASYAVAMGCPGIDLSFSEVFTMVIIICFFIALPSVPGYWGIWEAGGVFALALFGVGSEEAAGYTLANHAIQLLPVMLVGLISAWITSVDILKVSYAGDSSAALDDDMPGSVKEVIND